MRAHIRQQILRGVIVAAALGVAACGGGSGGGGGNADSSSYDAGPGPQGGAALYAEFRASKKLVLHQRDLIAVTPSTFRDRLSSMESALDAFDGVFLRLPNTSDAVLKNQPLAASAIADDLKPIYGVRPTKLRHNFAVVTANRDFDVFDDPTALLGNVARLAAVARDAGLVGIVIDNENPASLRVNYPDDVKDDTKTIEEYRAQTQEISRRIMGAITGAFPDAVVVVLRGPAGAEPRSPFNLVNMEEAAPLLGPYFAGFVEGNGARSLVVDGGTDYGLRTGEQFAASADWRNVQIASDATASAFIPESLRPAWPGITTSSFGVRELDGARGNLLPNDTGLWANTLIGALRAADNMVWASFDTVDMTTATGSNAWVVASRRARAAAATPTGGLLGASPPASGTGLLAQYFLTYYEAELAQTMVDPQIDFVWSYVGVLHTILGERADNLSVIWSGYVEAPVSGTYTIYGLTDDGMQVFIGEQAVIDAFYTQAPTEHAGTIALVAGQRYPIKVRYFQGGGESEAHVSWQRPGGVKEAIPTAYLYPYR